MTIREFDPPCDLVHFAHDVRGFISCVQVEIEALTRAADMRTRSRAASMQKAIDRLVDYCRCAAAAPSAFGVPRSSSSLLETCDDAARRLSASATEAIGIEVAGDDAELTPATATALHRMLINLGRNAVAAMSAAGPGRIAIRTTRLRDRLCIDVADTGPGLPETVLDRLFPRLGAPAPAIGRVGLGLASTTALASQLGGELILLKSDPCGAIFRISIPASDDVSSATWLSLHGSSKSVCGGRSPHALSTELVSSENGDRVS